MKVYCEDCKHFQKAATSAITGGAIYGYKLARNNCWFEKNITFDEEKNKKYPHQIEGLFGFADYLTDVVTWKRQPEDINKNNNCKWFELKKLHWWNFNKRKYYNVQSI